MNLRIELRKILDTVVEMSRGMPKREDYDKIDDLSVKLEKIIYMIVEEKIKGQRKDGDTEFTGADER